MINKIQHIISNSTVPYENMALEKYLMNTVAEDTCILYLWQNKRTVVIGKNQNVWQECNLKSIEDDKGYLARRLSGGGAVFHDLGNLNFTFIVSQKNYNVMKQTQVIIDAIKSFGIDVKLSGRNDLTIDGKKFSGNAFYKNGKNAYHHGTLLVKVNMINLSKYLNVSKLKLKSNGVASVVSRVINLNELSKEITIVELKKRLIKSFEKIYNLSSSEIKQELLDKECIDEIRDKFASWEWKFGRKIPFNVEFTHRFSWGEINLQLFVDKGIIKDVIVFSDAMNSEIFEGISEILKDKPYSSKVIAEILKDMFDSRENTELGFEKKSTISKDLFDYFIELNF